LFGTKRGTEGNGREASRVKQVVGFFIETIVHQFFDFGSWNWLHKTGCGLVPDDQHCTKIVVSDVEIDFQ